jgi:hypothetical protein
MVIVITKLPSHTEKVTSDAATDRVDLIVISSVIGKWLIYSFVDFTANPRGSDAATALDPHIKAKWAFLTGDAVQWSHNQDFKDTIYLLSYQKMWCRYHHQ